MDNQQPPIKTNSFGFIYTGPAKTNPGVLKAQADKAKSDSVVSAYKQRTDQQKAAIAIAAKKNGLR